MLLADKVLIRAILTLIYLDLDRSRPRRLPAHPARCYFASSLSIVSLYGQFLIVTSGDILFCGELAENRQT